MKMHTDAEELHPESGQTSTSSYVLHESMGSRLSRLGLLGKIVAALAVVVLALFITTIALGLRQQSERTLDNENLAQMEIQLQKALIKPERQNRIDKDYCPLRYNGTCFWVVMRNDKVNLAQASQICASQGGRLANIYSRDHYYMMSGYMRMFAVNQYAYFHTWIGMSYDREKNVTLLSDGSAAPFVRWRPLQPALHNCCNMYIFVRANVNSREQHMSTAAPGFRLEGVFCQK